MKVLLLKGRAQEEEYRPREKTDCLFESQIMNIMGNTVVMYMCTKCNRKNAFNKILKCPSNLTDDEAIVRDILK